MPRKGATFLQVTATLTPTFFWVSPPGRTLLELTTELARASDFDLPATALRLKKLDLEHPTETVNTALDIVAARHKAAPRLGPKAAELLMTTRSVEQASRPEIAARHASRFRDVPRLLEVGTGAGFDTAALAGAATSVVSLEPDPVLADMARHNLTTRGIANVTVITTSLEEYLTRSDRTPFDAVFADPSRRDEAGGRIKAGSDYRPPLNLVMSLECPGLCGIKVSPAINLDLPTGWTREFIGYGGECLEQTAWRGLGGPAVTVHLADHVSTWHPAPDTPPIDYVPPAVPLTGFLLDPHPALTRSGELESFYAAHGIAALDPACGYGVTSSTPSDSPFYRRFRIIESAPYRPRELAARLAELGWASRTEIKKRGVDEDPDEVRKMLKLKKTTHARDPYGVVLLARRGDTTVAILAERISASGDRAV